MQSGYERAINALVPALAGADELSGIGEMEAGVLSSFAQIVADDEIAGGVRRLRAGITADEQALAVDVITSVMRGARNFLAQKHTRQYMRSGEVLLTSLADRCTWEIWEREGRQEMADRAWAKAEEILAQHEVPPLLPEQENALNEIMQSAQTELVG